MFFGESLYPLKFFSKNNGKIPLQEVREKNKDLFQKEKKRIIVALGDKISVEHIGSTAIEGLGDKGIIDAVIGIKILGLN